MLCPQCSVVMKMAFRDGVEIDYCPKCRGIWLDRGELDKLLDRTLDERHSERFINEDKNDDDSSEFYVTADKSTTKRKRHMGGKKEYTKARKRPEQRKSSKKVSDFIEDIFDIFD